MTSQIHESVFNLPIYLAHLHIVICVTRNDILFQLEVSPDKNLPLWNHFLSEP